jgi:hypothetical protein
MELNRNLLNLNNRNFGSIEKFRLVENRLKTQISKHKLSETIGSSQENSVRSVIASRKGKMFFCIPTYAYLARVNQALKPPICDVLVC